MSLAVIRDIGVPVPCGPNRMDDPQRTDEPRLYLGALTDLMFKGDSQIGPSARPDLWHYPRRRQGECPCNKCQPCRCH